MAEELTTPTCLLQVSTLVNARAQRFLQNKLRGSEYGSEHDIRAMLDVFEKSTKPTFKDPSHGTPIRFGRVCDNNIAFGIQGGKLTLAGEDLASFFEPSICGIIDAVHEQVAESTDRVPTAFLVGGFAASPWLYLRLQARLQPHRMGLCRPNTHTNKAVAEGAVSFHLKRFVSARIAKVAYGKSYSIQYDPTDPEHIVRQGHIITQPSGKVVIPGHFTVLLPRGARIREIDEFEVSLTQEAPHESALNHLNVKFECYRGKAEQPRWLDEEPEMFHTICTLSADTSGVARTRLSNPSGGFYYTQDYKVILLCGLTEMKAQISWMQNGRERRGPASLVYAVEATS